MDKNKSYNWLRVSLIIVVVIIVGALIFSSNSAKDNQFICPDGSIVSNYSICNQQEERIVTIVTIRTNEQYNNLRQMFPGEPEIAACNYDLYYKEGKSNSICNKILSITQDPNQDYIFVCECSIWE